VGTFTMSRAAFPALQQTGDAAIINISATLHYGATWYQVHASAAKAAVDSITRSLALEWGEYGVRVNGVAPGPIKGTAGADAGAAGRHGGGAARTPAGMCGAAHSCSSSPARPTKFAESMDLDLPPACIGVLVWSTHACCIPTHTMWPSGVLCVCRHVQAGSW
jgi:NAD(P)-dependent dehydrogenase (short-subunit alcohol dehydrogenase family)